MSTLTTDRHRTISTRPIPQPSGRQPFPLLSSHREDHRGYVIQVDVHWVDMGWGDGGREQIWDWYPQAVVFTPDPLDLSRPYRASAGAR